MATQKTTGSASVSLLLTDDTFVSLTVFLCIPVVLLFILKN